MYQIEKDYTVEFIRQHADSIDWEILCSYAPLDLIDEIIADYPDDIKWWKVSRRRDITEAFIRKYSKNIKWFDLSQCADFEIICNVIDDHLEEIDWNHFSLRELPEDFIRKYSHKISWYFFSRSIFLRKYSEQIFEDFADVLDWEYILDNIIFSAEFKQLHKDKIRFHDLP